MLGGAVFLPGVDCIECYLMGSCKLFYLSFESVKRKASRVLTWDPNSLSKSVVFSHDGYIPVCFVICDPYYITYYIVPDVFTKVRLSENTNILISQFKVGHFLYSFSYFIQEIFQYKATNGRKQGRSCVIHILYPHGRGNAALHQGLTTLDCNHNLPQW